MWENLVPPFNIYCGGTSIIRGGPSGHSVTHPPGKWHSGFKWDKTFASGICISKPNVHTGAVWRCYVRLPSLPPPAPPKTGGKIKKRQWEGPCLTNRWELQFSSFLFLSPINPFLNSTSRPIPEHSYSDGRRSASSSSDPPTSSDKCQHPPRPHPTQPLVAPRCTISVAPQPVLTCCLALFMERPIRHCSGQAACASQACSLLGRPCQTRPAQYAPAKRQSGPPS